MSPTMIRPTLKAKRRCCTSFFITDILRHKSRSPSPTSVQTNSNLIHKDSESIDDDDDDDDRILHESDENGK